MSCSVEKRFDSSDKIVNLADFVYDRSWKEVFRGESKSGVEVLVHVNKQTGEFDITLSNDEGEAINASLSIIDSESLVAAVNLAHRDNKKA